MKLFVFIGLQLNGLIKSSYSVLILSDDIIFLELSILLIFRLNSFDLFEMGLFEFINLLDKSLYLISKLIIAMI